VGAIVDKTMVLKVPNEVLSAGISLKCTTHAAAAKRTSILALRPSARSVSYPEVRSLRLFLPRRFQLKSPTLSRLSPVCPRFRPSILLVVLPRLSRRESDLLLAHLSPSAADAPVALLPLVRKPKQLTEQSVLALRIVFTSSGRNIPRFVRVRPTSDTIRHSQRPGQTP